MTDPVQTGAPRPQWLDALAAKAAEQPDPTGRWAVPADDAAVRHSAVLVLFGPTPGGGEDVVLTERAHDMRSHPGQVSFPGGRTEPGDADAAATALREAGEEVGLDPASVEVVAEFPAIYLPPSSSAVTPVLAWWARPHEIGVVDRAEVEHVARVPVTDLLEPTRRFTVTHPSGYVGGGFDAGDLFVWGFTATLLDRVLDLAGLTLPWDRTVNRPLPDRYERMQRAATGQGWKDLTAPRATDRGAS